jgi:membrane-associated phospholipid phosphatase
MGPDSQKRKPSTAIVLSPRRSRILIGAGAILWIVAILLWRQAGLDRTIQIAHNALRASAPIAAIAKGLSTYGMAFCVLVYLSSLVMSTRYRGLRDLRRVMLAVLLSFAVAGPVGDLFKEIIARPRPFEQYPLEIVPITRPPAYSLPSGHTTKVFALVLPFVALAPAGKGRKAIKAGLLLVAAAVSYSRIVLGVHFLGDILAGIGTALIALPLAAAASNAVYSAKGMTEKRAGILAVICGLILLVLIFVFIRNSL